MRELISLFICAAMVVPSTTWASATKDPLNYPLSQYGLMLAISLLGGFVSWYAKVKKGEIIASNLMALIGELATSALAGLLAFYVCEWANAEPVLTAAIVGVAGHMGTRGIAALEEFLQRWLERKATP
jgi:NhaP-type Na+/H+ and K+/H+ antiporter